MIETLLIAGAVTGVTGTVTYLWGVHVGKQATCEKHAAEIKKLQGRLDAYRTTVPAMQQELRQYHQMQHAARTIRDGIDQAVKYGRTVIAK